MIQECAARAAEQALQSRIRDGMRAINDDVDSPMEFLLVHGRDASPDRRCGSCILSEEHGGVDRSAARLQAIESQPRLPGPLTPR